MIFFSLAISLSTSVADRRFLSRYETPLLIVWGLIIGYLFLFYLVQFVCFISFSISLSFSPFIYIYVYNYLMIASVFASVCVVFIIVFILKCVPLLASRLLLLFSRIILALVVVIEVFT